MLIIIMAATLALAGKVDGQKAMLFGGVFGMLELVFDILIIMVVTAN